MTGPQLSASDHLELEQVESLISAAGIAGAQDIMAAFWRSTEDLLQDIETNLAASSFDAAKRTAHALKGSAANVGAKRLADTANELEAACRAGGADAAGQHLAAAKEDYRNARRFIEERLQNGAA